MTAPLLVRVRVALTCGGVQKKPRGQPLTNRYQMVERAVVVAGPAIG